MHRYVMMCGGDRALGGGGHISKGHQNGTLSGAEQADASVMYLARREVTVAHSTCTYRNAYTRAALIFNTVSAIKLGGTSGR